MRFHSLRHLPKKASHRAPALAETWYCASGQRPLDRQVRHPGSARKIFAMARWKSVGTDLLGEHNEQVLRGLLSISDSEIAALYADKVLVRDQLLDSDALNSRSDHELAAPHPSTIDVAKSKG